MPNMISKAWGGTGRFLSGAAKAFTMRFRSTGFSWLNWRLPGSQFDYEKEVGDGGTSNIITAVTRWIARNAPEAPLQVLTETPEGIDEIVVGHPMVEKVRRPNPFYSGVHMWMSTYVDWTLNGNAYWAIVKTRGGDVAELWWLPSWMVEPKWPEGDSTTYISHYDYRPNAGLDAVKIAPEDIVHFRFGLDPGNTRKGVGALGPLLREAFTDAEAATFTAAVLHNMGVPGVVLSPEGNEIEIDTEEANNIRDDARKKFGGDNRGDWMVMSGPTKVTRVSLSPEELDLRGLRRIPEERVTAQIGIPAIVVGFGAGLDRATYANIGEAREMAYENFIIPSQRIMLADLDSQLLPHFSEDASERSNFDLSKVRVLQEDENKKSERMAAEVAGGFREVAEARAERGLEVRESDRVYLRSAILVEVPAGQPAPPRNSPGQAGRTGEIEMKAAPIVAARERRISQAAKALADFLHAQAKRVAGRLLASEGKGLTEDVMPPSELRELERALGSIHLASIDIASEIAGAQVGRAALTAADPGFRSLLDRVSQRIVGVDATTKAEVSKHLEAGRARGLTTRQIVNGVPATAEAPAFPSLADSFGFSEGRAGTIARTEVATAENWTATQTWRESGIVVEADILDGDGCGWTSHDDPDTAHGSTRTLSDVDAHPVAHPNCVRVPVPKVEVAVPA